MAAAKRELTPTLGLPEQVEGGILVRGSADELDWYARELMRLPFPFEVRAPVELKRALAKIAGEIARQYAV
jgi:predicted DNA-binding transcriptional regulator YafY